MNRELFSLLLSNVCKTKEEEDFSVETVIAVPLFIFLVLLEVELSLLFAVLELVPRPTQLDFLLFPPLACP
jgi:hypothetical protein